VGEFAVLILIGVDVVKKNKVIMNTYVFYLKEKGKFKIGKGRTVEAALDSIGSHINDVSFYEEGHRVYYFWNGYDWQLKFSLDGENTLIVTRAFIDTLSSTVTTILFTAMESFSEGLDNSSPHYMRWRFDSKMPREAIKNAFFSITKRDWGS
jgi:hypothetical protein